MFDPALSSGVLSGVLIGILAGIGTSAIVFVASRWLTRAFLVGQGEPPQVRWRRVLLALSLVAGLLVGLPQVYRIVSPAHHSCAASPAAGAVDWIAPDPGGQGAVGSESIAQPVGACQTLMLTGRAFVAPDGRMCSGSVTQICVLLVASTYEQTIRVSGLEPMHSWYGVTASNPTQALAWQAPNFWMPVNCETGRGCDSATVYRYLDGEFVDHFELLPNRG
jgi:hypothetical protein